MTSATPSAPSPCVVRRVPRTPACRAALGGAADVAVSDSPRRVWSRREIKEVRMAPMAVAAVAAVYLVLASLAFFTNGFSLSIGQLSIGVRAPQKLLRIALGLGALAAIIQVWQAASRSAVRDVLSRIWPMAAGFVAGYSPLLLYSIFVGPAHSPLRSANLSPLLHAEIGRAAGWGR